MRTIITISEEDKKWLDGYSRSRKLSRAEAIRQALKEFKQRHQKSTYKEAIERTFGSWGGKQGDALEYVRQLRKDRDLS